MIKLKQVILQLSDESFAEIKGAFIKNKADNFVQLLESYRVEGVADKDIIEKLGVSSNSFYVLKSRLYDRIQESLSADVFSNQETLIHQLLQVPEICFNRPREIAIAFLQKLEKELLRYDLHNDLMVVYSALKKMHLYSEKYFHYSQLFNKHAGLGLSLEKAEELLGNFTRMLGQYNFSKNQQYLDTMNFLRIEIANLYSLNSSRQIEIIRNLIDLQLIIFAQNSSAIELSTEELLQSTRKIFAELPETAAQKKWELVLDYLYFEYYFSKSELKLAAQYYEKVNAEINTFLLYNNICLTSRFLVSKIKFCDEAGRPFDLDLAKPGEIVFDSMDTHAKVMVGVYTSMISYRHKKIKEAINVLNEIINSVSFKDYFHESIDVKMTLAYFYMALKDYDLVEITLKSISRKIKTEAPDKYNQVLSLIKVFDNEMANAGSVKSIAKNKDLFTLFLANNTKSNEVLIHLIPELKRKYQS
jgi:hypothetical protein